MVVVDFMFFNLGMINKIPGTRFKILAANIRNYAIIKDSENNNSIILIDPV
jgi:hypothetical protein